MKRKPSHTHLFPHRTTTWTTYLIDGMVQDTQLNDFVHSHKWLCGGFLIFLSTFWQGLGSCCKRLVSRSSESLHFINKKYSYL